VLATTAISVVKSEGGIEHQTQEIFESLAVILEAAGKSFADVIRVGVFLSDMTTFGAMNAIYAKYFNEPYPARTAVAVTALPLAAAVGIEMVAGG
jgi:2-iminobutanoate/2-iminopropanoate deaminase